MTSKVQSSPRWLQNTFSMSKGAASKRSPTATTSDGATNRNTALGSTKRRISQGQAMRSTLGRARVTQTVRPLRVARRQLARVDQRQLCSLPALEPALQRLGLDAELPQPGRRALREFCAALAETMAERPANSPPQSGDIVVAELDRRRGSAGGRRRNPRRCAHRSGQGHSPCRSSVPVCQMISSYRKT